MHSITMSHCTYKKKIKKSLLQLVISFVLHQCSVGIHTVQAHPPNPPKYERKVTKRKH